MTDFATLVLAADTRQLTQAQRAIDDVAKSGERAEKQTNKTTGAFGNLNRVAPQTRKSVDGIGLGFSAMTKAAGAAAASLATLAAGAVSLGVALRDARQFGAAIAEVTTLMGDSASETALLEKNARALGVAYGTGAIPQVKAFYQAISAGAGDVAEATALLDQANKLAIGGATDVTTAVDILTTATNVYSDSGLSAADASNALFVAMRAGKTTIGELSASLGKVLPLANNLGVSFDEVAAATAALTLGGISTAESVTGLRAAMTSILGPTKQASDLAKTLGLDFSAAGLEGLGFAGFMEEVVAKTGGSSEAMQQLFGSVEAVTVALALSGSAGASLGTILDQMETKAGATDAAFQKMSETFDQRLNRATAALADIGIRVGNVLLTVLVPALEAVVKIIQFASDNSAALGVVLAGLAATQIPVAVVALAGMTTGMTAAGIATGVFTRAVTLARLGLIALGGPIGIVFGLIGAAAAAFVAFGNDTSTTAQATKDAEEAQNDLNEALEAFSRNATPANQAAVDRAAFMLDQAKKTLAAAAAEEYLQGVMARTGQTAQTMSSQQQNLMDHIDNSFGIDRTVDTTNESLAKLNELIVSLGGEVVTTTVGLYNAEDAIIETGGAAGSAASAINSLQDEIEQLNLDPDPFAKYNAEIDRLNELSALGLSEDALAQAIASANDELANSIPMLNDFTSAFENVLNGSIKTFKDFAQTIFQSFRNLMAQLVATAVRNRIMISLGMGGSVAGTAASAAGSGMGGAIAGAGGMAGLGSAALGGAQFVASGFASGGLAGAGSALATAASGATMGIGGAAAAIGAFAVPLAIIAAPLMIFAAASARRTKRRMKEIEAQTQKLESETKRKDEETVQRLQANVDATDALIASLQTLAQLEQQREQAARAILSEREGLEVELLRLQNDLVALREREVQALEPVNRQLGRFIFAMKDASEAINAQRQAVTALAGAGRGIVDFVRDIRNQAGASFQADLALARAGDAGASQRLPSSAQAAIDQARATATSGAQFDRFVAQTAASLMALPAVATFEEQQIALLEELNAGVADLNALQSATQRQLIAAIDEGFFVIDTNLDGKLTFEELKAGLGGIATDAELRNIFDQLDKNGDGLIDQFEKLIGVEDVNSQSLANVIASGFNQLDTNLDGKLTFEELKAGLGGIATDQELRQIFSLLDRNNDGVIDNLERIIGTQMDSSEIVTRSLLAGFNQLDTNLDGKLTFEELQKGLGNIATDAELRNIFDQLDKNGDGLIDQFEKLMGVEDVNSQSLANVIASGFKALDTNLDGKLTFEELQKGLGHIATDAELRELFKLTDTNGDGTISQLEALGNSNHNIDDNTLDSWIASQGQLSELKIIAGETANNTQKVASLTTAIENLVFGQKVAAAQQLASLEAQKTAAQTALESAQASLSETPEQVRIRKGNFFQRSIYAPNPQFAALQADIRRAQQELAALEAQILQVPAFAGGGMHSGGMRLVGENGPELEATGPSRIYNNGDTMNMLSNAPVVSELKQLRREIASFRDEQRQLGIQTSRNTDRTTRVLREWNATGLPEERTT